MTSQVPLGNVCEFVRGVTFDKAVVTSDQARPDLIPILRAGNGIAPANVEIGEAALLALSH